MNPWKRACNSFCIFASIAVHPVIAADSSQTEEPVQNKTLTANITLASQYVSRGYQLSWGKPALQGGVDYVHPNGFFIGAWMSTVSPKFIQEGHLECDLYAGYAIPVGSLSLTGTLYYYVFPGAEISGLSNASGNPVKYDFGELLISATWKWATLNYWYTYTNNYYGSNGDTLFDSAGVYYENGKHSRGSDYFDAILNYEFSNGYSMSLHYGYQRIKNFSAWNFADYRIGITKTFESLAGAKGWSVSANYTGVTKVNDYYKNKNSAVPFVSATGDGSTSRPVDNQFIVTVTKTF